MDVHPCFEVVKLIIDGLVALGTLLVVVAAIWGDWLRAKLVPSKLALVGHTLDGGLPTKYVNGAQAMFFQMKVINQGPLSAKNCRVMLVGMSKRDPSGNFQPEPLAYPCQLTWSPVEFLPSVMTISPDQLVDLGYVNENGQAFVPRLYYQPVTFSGLVGPNEAVRYEIQIEAENFTSPRYVVEVAWNGRWSFVPDEMRRHLPISPPTTQ
jgi:hypothetical protein